MAPKPRTGADGGDWQSKVKVAVVPDPGPQIRRDYSPKGSSVPGLNDMVWESYLKGETMVIGTPPGREGEVRDELLKAKNYLNYLHRDDDPKVDVRGLEKAAVQVVTADEIEQMPAKQRTIYRKAVPMGWNGIRFTARPPLMKGRRAQQARLRAQASKSRRREGTVTEIERHREGAPEVRFSGR